MSLEELARQVRRCRKCVLWRTRKKAVPGEGDSDARIFLVGEAPGREEDKKGRPFVGTAGRILDESLKKANLKREEVFITSVLKCRPPGNRNPRRAEIEKCRYHLESQIEEVDPDVIVALGAFGSKVLTGKSEKVSEARRVTGEYEGRLLVTTYHPAAVLYNRRLMKHLGSDLRKAKEFAESEDVRMISRPAREGKRNVSVCSAGGVILRGGRILLIRKRSEKLWCLPKGHREKGEDSEQTALREMREETGLGLSEVEGKLCSVEYSYYWPQTDVNYYKEVTYFLARAPGNQKPKLESRFDRYRWCTEQEALKLLHHRNDISVAKKAFKVQKK
ncbi:MAG: uracil-DNA glycosylase family protein [Thermoplasmata archaeon]